MKNIIISILTMIIIMSFGYGHDKGYRHNYHHCQSYKNPWKVKLQSHQHHDHNSWMKSKYWKGKYLNVMDDYKLLCVDYENLLKDYEMLEQDYEKMMEDVETQQSTDTSEN